MGRVSNVGIVTVAIRRPHIARVILPGARPDDVRCAVSPDPRRTVHRSALIIFVPAILYPLIDPTAHIVQSKWIGFKTADLDRLVGRCDVGAILAICHAGLQLVAPPILGLGSSSRGIFPFGFARKPVGPSRGVREPRGILLGIAPAYIRDRRLVVS